MAHERDEKYEGQDDSEYHFSDDQVNYESDSAGVKPSTASKTKAEILAKIKYYKRPLIGVAVFLVLIFVIYKIITPNASKSTTVATQGNEQTTAPIQEAKPTKAAMNEMPPSPVKVATPAEPQPTSITPPPNLAPTQQSQAVIPEAPQQQTQNLPPQQAMTPPQQPAAEAMPSQAPQQAMQQQAMQQQQMPQQQAIQQPSQPEMAAPTAMNQPQQPIASTQSQVVVQSTANMSIPDRLTVLETQSAKTQSDLMQKISEQEAQNTALQGKLQDLNMRMTSIEQTLIRLGRIMHEMKGGKAMDEAIIGEPVRMVARPAPAPKVTYSVQAIIPGRAWLKSEVGETVTVAEGDAVKDLGRVVKIDPYDGVVQIDANGRMISLSYGASNE